MMAHDRSQPWWRAVVAGHRGALRRLAAPAEPLPAGAPAGASVSSAAGRATAPAPGMLRHLSLRGISKHFGPVGVLHDVSFTVRAGEFVTLLGPSGCGKTTLLRIVAGLETPDAGEVRLGALDLTGLPANRRPVNTVFQSYALFPHLSVEANVAFGLRARRVPAGEVAQRVGAALDMLQLAELRHRYPDQMSGGQKQRVALARALVNQPEVLLLDEPMSALDAKLRAEVQEELRRLQQRLGKTFILVTHDQDEAMTVSDRIMVMCAGRIVQEGAPADVYEHPVNRFVAEFLGSANLIAVRRGQGGRAVTALGELCLDQPLPWDEGTLAIRPEHVRLAAQRPAQNGVAVVIKEVFYRGAHLEVVAEVAVPAGSEAVGSAHPTVRVQTPPTVKVKAGERAWLELAPQYLEVLA